MVNVLLATHHTAYCAIILAAFHHIFYSKNKRKVKKSSSFDGAPYQSDFLHLLYLFFKQVYEVGVLGLLGPRKYALEPLKVAGQAYECGGEIHEEGFGVIAVLCGEHFFEVAEERLPEVPALSLILDVVEVGHRPLVLQDVFIALALDILPPHFLLDAHVTVGGLTCGLEVQVVVGEIFGHL